MMDAYSLQRLAHTEHIHRVRSLPKVYDFAYPTVPEPSRWSQWIAGLRALAGHILTSPPNPPRRSRPVLLVLNPSLFLRNQLREDSNCEQDWLWAAGQVTVADEIRYCLERPLYINPDNRETQRTLFKLIPYRAASHETLTVNPHDSTQVSDH
jgi:hypothetical protein